MFTTWDPKLSLLEGIPLFAGCDRRELRAIGGLGDLTSRHSGTVLIEEGEFGGEAFVIVDGTVTVSQDGDVLATLGPGDVVGDVAILDYGPRTATVTADTPIKVLVFDPGAFNGLLRKAPDVTRRMLAETARRLRNSDGSETTGA